MPCRRCLGTSETEVGHNPFLLATCFKPTPVGLGRPEETPWGGHGSPSSLPNSWHSCLRGDPALKCGVSCPPRPRFCCPHLSEAAGSSRLAQVCLPDRLRAADTWILVRDAWASPGSSLEEMLVTLRGPGLAWLAGRLQQGQTLIRTSPPGVAGWAGSLNRQAGW